MESLKFSVITVSYNQGEFIRDTIESVLAQNYQNFEHLVIDGGSTDDTLSILKEYDHLKWTSEPDRGQTHALEKGFARATGDIIAWINSDDWYAPGIFHQVAEALESYPTVLAPAGETDREGNVKLISPNIPRNWFQQLKYWVPYAWLVQPSVFFRRSVLDEVRRDDGTILDESLYFCMDYDLWMRIGQCYPFTRYLPTTASYYRMYEDNKTGAEAEAAQWENSRVYRRYCSRLAQSERSHSILIPFDGPPHALSTTLESLKAQILQDLEVVLVSYGDALKPREIRKFALTVRGEYRHFQVRHLHAETSHFLEACNQGITSAAAETITILQPGDTLPSDYFLHVHNVLVTDSVGVIVPLADKPAMVSALSREVQGIRLLTLQGIMDGPFCSMACTFRKATLLDLGGFQSSECPALAMRELLLRAIYHCWNIVIDAPLAVQEAKDYTVVLEQQQLLQPYLKAQLIVQLSEELAQDSFSDYLAREHRQSVQFAEPVIKAARKLLQQAPPRWWDLTLLAHKQDVQALLEQYPAFSPLWKVLALHCKTAGSHAEAESAEQRYQHTREAENLAL